MKVSQREELSYYPSKLPKILLMQARKSKKPLSLCKLCLLNNHLLQRPMRSRTSMNSVHLVQLCLKSNALPRIRLPQTSIHFFKGVTSSKFSLLTMAPACFSKDRMPTSAKWLSTSCQKIPRTVWLKIFKFWILSELLVTIHTQVWWMEKVAQWAAKMAFRINHSSRWTMTLITTMSQSIL